MSFMKKVGVLLRNKLYVRKKPRKCFKEEKQEDKSRKERKTAIKKGNTIALFEIIIFCSVAR